MRFEGWHAKNMALKGGASQNSVACKKVVNQKNSFKFCNGGIRNYANVCHQIWSLTFRN